MTEALMMETLPVLSAQLADVFMEAIARSGSQLAALADREIVFRGSHISFIRLEELPLYHEDGPETLVTAIYVTFHGGIDGHVVLSFSPKIATRLAQTLLMYENDLDTPALRQLADSALEEIGNVVAATFLNVVADAARFTVLPTPPCIVHDMWGAVLQSVVVEIAEEQAYGISVECHISVDGDSLAGSLILLPSLASCKRLEEALLTHD